MANGPRQPDSQGLPIKRNLALVSAAVAANTCMLQLISGVASISLARVLDVTELLGLGPAIVLAAGAFAAVPAGRAMDRLGRTHALAGGLLLMAVSVSCLLWAQGAHATAAALFGLGLGWNLSFVAATAELADRTEPAERGSLLGFNDSLSGATGAALTLVGGFALTAAGVAALAVGAIGLVVAPTLWILGDGAAATLPAIHQRLPEERTMHPYLAVILSEERTAMRAARRHADLRTAR